MSEKLHKAATNLVEAWDKGISLQQYINQLRTELYDSPSSSVDANPDIGSHPACVPTSSEDTSVTIATEQEVAEYERLHAWRARWSVLAKKVEPGRLCSRQERIERRALVCNLKIAKLMHAFDVRVNNTYNPIGQKGVDAAVMTLLLATH